MGGQPEVKGKWEMCWTWGVRLMRCLKISQNWAPFVESGDLKVDIALWQGEIINNIHFCGNWVISVFTVPVSIVKHRAHTGFDLFFLQCSLHVEKSNLSSKQQYEDINGKHSIDFLWNTALLCFLNLGFVEPKAAQSNFLLDFPSPSSLRGKFH